MSFRRQNMWPVVSPKPEDAIFTIVLHPDVYLYKAGGKLQGDIYIHFKDTKEEISFQNLKIYLKENVNLPEETGSQKNVTARIIDEKVLVDQDNGSNIYSYYIKKINESNDVQIPFEFILPQDLSSSFNSKNVTICYELKAEMQELVLCGEVCDLSTSQAVELKEVPSEEFEFEHTAQIQQAVNSQLSTFSASTDKLVYHTDDDMKVEIFLDAPGCREVMIEFEVVQLIELKRHSHWETVVNRVKETFPINSSGVLTTSTSFFLENSIFSSQPSVYRSGYIGVGYAVRLISYIQDEALELEIPILIEREHALGGSYPRIVSTNNLPLLPLTITVNELKNDGLQSYIPLKQCYENRRLSVRKGNINGVNALLTIVSESYKPYTNDQKIKGYVYLKVKDAEEDLKFSSLLILLVGVRRFRHGSTLRSRNGEMFLYERKVLKGDKNHNASEMTLSKKSGLIIVGFEFDLGKLEKTLPPSFNSDELSISYELKADVFNLSVAGEKASLYTTLPVSIRGDKSQVHLKEVSGLRTMSKLCGKEVFVFLNTEKTVYQHNDVLQVRINVDNKSKKQLNLKVKLLQIVELFRFNQDVHQTVVSTPIILLILPRSKLLSTESLSLKHSVFHHQPTLTTCDDIRVTYKLIIDAPMLNNQDLRDGVPITILRRYGHTIKELTREGYPLLPITLEFYSKDTPSLPSYLTDYSNKRPVKVLNSNTCFDRWKGWKVK